jgi:hypothetical protein
MPRGSAVPGDQSFAGLLTVLTCEAQLMTVTVLPPQHALSARAWANQAMALATTTGSALRAKGGKLVRHVDPAAAKTARSNIYYLLGPRAR